MSHPKTRQIQCLDCKKQWMVRSDTAKKFKGRCRPCTSRKVSIGNKGRTGQTVTPQWLEQLRLARKNIKTGTEHHLAGKKLSEEHRRKISEGVLKIMTVEVRQKIGDAHRGEKSITWKGGVTSQNEILRKSSMYRLWRKAVFERDGYVCVMGGKEHGNKLQADHIKRWSEFPELRFAIDNGRTLCEECHRKTDTWGRKNLLAKNIIT